MKIDCYKEQCIKAVFLNKLFEKKIAHWENGIPCYAQKNPT